MPLTQPVPELETPPVNANPRRVVAALFTVGLCGAAGCGASPSPTASTPAPATPAASFGGTDRAWLEINIAMDEELLPLLDLAPANARDPALKQLSAQFKVLTADELSTLRRLHDEAGLPAVNPHKGMPMPGMVTPSLVAEAAGQRGAAFDSLLTRSLREHLEQGQMLAGSEQSSGAETRTKELAASILKSRATTLAQLKKDS